MSSKLSILAVNGVNETEAAGIMESFVTELESRVVQDMDVAASPQEKKVASSDESGGVETNSKSVINSSTVINQLKSITQALNDLTK